MIFEVDDEEVAWIFRPIDGVSDAILKQLYEISPFEMDRVIRDLVDAANNCDSPIEDQRAAIVNLAFARDAISRRIGLPDDSEPSDCDPDMLRGAQALVRKHGVSCSAQQLCDAVSMWGRIAQRDDVEELRPGFTLLLLLRERGASLNRP